MPASEIHQRYITTPFDDLSQPFWCKRRAIVVQGRMQPVVHRPRGTRDVVVSRCSRPFVAGCRRVRRLTICGGGLDFAACTQTAYREWTASGQVSRIGVMIAGNSGRPGGSIYKPWFSSPQHARAPCRATRGAPQQRSYPGACAPAFVCGRAVGPPIPQGSRPPVPLSPFRLQRSRPQVPLQEASAPAGLAPPAARVNHGLGPGVADA